MLNRPLHNSPYRVLGLAAVAAVLVLAMAGPVRAFDKLKRPTDGKPSVLFIGPPAGYVEPDLVAELTRKGFVVDSAQWRAVSIERLRRFNTVVLLTLGCMNEDAWQARYGDELNDYMRLGGSVILFFAAGSGEGIGLEARPWLAECGITLYHEGILDPTNAKPHPGGRYVYGQKFAPADRVTPHPVTRGVKGIWYLNQLGGHPMVNAVPLELDASWTSLVRTRPEAKLHKFGDATEGDYREKMEGKAGSWTIVASRRMGNGRMVAVGLKPLFHIYAPHFHHWQQIPYSKGIGDVPSNFDVLLENALRWTAEPSLGKGLLGWWAGLYPPTSQGDTPPVDWTTRTFSAPGPWLRGHVGARTGLSGGKGTVADWVAAAGKEGLCFLVFLEDMRRMDEQKWLALRAQCREASSDAFRAYPGMAYQMKIATGGTNHFFVIDGRDTLPFPPKKHMTENNEISIRKGMNQGPYHMDFKTMTTAGFMRHSDNATPFWDYKLYGILSVFAARGGKRLDDAIDIYLQAVAANVNPGPIAIEMLDDPAQLKGVLSGGRPHLVVNGAYDGRYPQLTKPIDQVDVHVGTRGDLWNAGYGMYRGWCGPTATEGPAASLRFRGGYAWKRVEYPRYWIERYLANRPADWFMPSYARLPLRLDVVCDSPIRELVIYDGPKAFRRFDARGKNEFHTEFWIAQDQNRHLVAYVKDSRNRRAVTAEIWTEQQQNLYNYCGDRINAPIGKGSEPGHGNMWPEGSLKMQPSCMWVAGRFPPTLPGTGLESRRYQLGLVSPDVFLERMTSNHYFPSRVSPHQVNPWGNWTAPVERDDVSHGSLRYEWYQAHDREYIHPAETGIRWDGYPYGPTGGSEKFAYYARQEIWAQTKKDLKPRKDHGFVPGLSQLVWEGKLPGKKVVRYTLYLPGGKTVKGSLADGPKRGLVQGTGSMPDGSAMVLDSGFTVRVHGKGLAYAFCVTQAQAALRIAPHSSGKAVPKGTRYRWWFETVAQVVPNPLDPDIRWLNVIQGRMLAHFVGATLQADAYAARVRVGKQPLTVNSTPLIVRGVSSNWTCGYYEPTSGLYRPIGSADGVTYAQVATSAGELDLVLGNVVTCDQPEVRINVVQMTDPDGEPTGQWLVDAHNPTRKTLTVAFTVPKAFGCIKTRSHKASVPAGASVTFSLR